jgi:hypothetical protein
MSNQEVNTKNAYYNLSKVEFKLGDVIGEVREAQEKYREALMNECIGNILKVQQEDGKLIERDLNIFLSDLITKVVSIRNQ